MSAWGGGNPGGGPGQGQGAAGFGGGYRQQPQGGYQPFGGGGAQYNGPGAQSTFNPPPADGGTLGQVNPAAAGVGGSTGGGGGVLSVPQTSFGMGGGGMQRPNGDAQPNGNFGRPQPMRSPMTQQGMGMQRPPMGYQNSMAMQRSMGPPPQQQSMQRPMGPPPSSILARMRGGGGQMGPPSTGGPMPGMSDTRLAQPDQFQPGPGGPQAPQSQGGGQDPAMMQKFIDAVNANRPAPQPSTDPGTNDMLRNSNAALASQVFGQ